MLRDDPVQVEGGSPSTAVSPGLGAHRWPLLCVVSGFAASRLAYRVLGVRFDASPLERFWQFIDPDLLRERLAESLIHLHAQPPLFNVYLAGVLKLFPERESAAFAVTYAALGLALAVSLYLVTTGLGTGRGLAVVLTLGFVASPPAVLYENWLFYAYPVTAMLCLAALLVGRCALTGRPLEVFALFTLLAAIALTWGLFHWLWYVVIWLCFVVLGRASRLRWLVAGAVPFVLLVSWSVKDVVLPGPVRGGSWIGMNLARMTTFLLSRGEREHMVAEGSLSEFALVPPFSPPEAYRSAFPPAEETGIPLLDREHKASGAVNFHHARYSEVGRRYLHDALVVLRRHPSVYLAGLTSSYAIAFFPASDSPFLLANRRRISGLDLAYSRACGQLRYAPQSSVEALPRQTPAARALAVGWIVVVVYGACVLYGVVRAFTDLCGPRPDPVRGWVTGFLVFNMLWVVVVGNALELGENNRFRFVVDPLCVALLGRLITEGLDRLRGVTERGR
jgi:hypothetical protein